MEGKHKSYGYEGGYEDWTADKVFNNMKIMQNSKQIAEVDTSVDKSYNQQKADKIIEWEEEYREDTRPTADLEREVR